MLCLEDYLSEHECDVVICTGDWVGFSEPYAKNILETFSYDFWGLFAVGELNYWNEEFLEKHAMELAAIKALLTDEKSRRVFDQIYEQRTKLTYARDFDEPSSQYFDKEIICFDKKEVFVDCGAFHGENLLELCKLIEADSKGTLAHAYELEMDPQNVAILKRQVTGIPNVEVIPKGAWSSSGNLPFRAQKGKSSIIDEGSEDFVPVTTIDECVGGERVTFIKMDIEDAELQALEGARKTIVRDKPKLAISVYHRPEDFIAIPQFISQLDIGYKLYLRAYSQTGCETILYAV